MKDQTRKQWHDRWVGFVIRMTRWIPFIKIPEDAIWFTVAQAKERAITAMSFMQMERQLGSFKFRTTIKLDDTELDKIVGENQIALMNASREYSICYNWMLMSGHIHEYVKFRAQVQQGIEWQLEQEKAAHTKSAMEKFK